MEDDTKLIAYLGRKYHNVLMKIGFSKDDIEGYTFLDDFNTNYDLNNVNNVNNDINVDYTNNVTIDNDLTFNNVPISENEGRSLGSCAQHCSMRRFVNGVTVSGIGSLLFCTRMRFTSWNCESFLNANMPVVSS